VAIAVNSGKYERHIRKLALSVASHPSQSKLFKANQAVQGKLSKARQVLQGMAACQWQVKARQVVQGRANCLRHDCLSVAIHPRHGCLSVKQAQVQQARVQQAQKQHGCLSKALLIISGKSSKARLVVSGKARQIVQGTAGCH